MAAKRKIRKGFATDLLCFLHKEGAASTEHLARRFGYSSGVTDRALYYLSSRDLIGLSPMHPGAWSLYPKGASLIYRNQACATRGGWRGTR